MQKFNLDNELNRIQKNNIEKKRLFQLNRIPVYILVLLIVMTFSLNASYSVEVLTTEKSNLRYSVHVEVINGYQDNYDFLIDQPSFNKVIDSNYKDAELVCNNSNVKYNAQNRLIYGNSVDSDVNCTLIFDDNSFKSSIDYNKLKRANDNTGISYYYPADADDNYIMINYMMFRIVRVNGDGSLRVILNNNFDNSVFGTEDYISSNALTLTKEWFSSEVEGLSYVVSADYDIKSYDDRGDGFENDLMDFDSMYFDVVGFLSVNEVMLINGSNKIDTESYLYGDYFTSSVAEDGSVWAVKNGDLVTTISKNTVTGLRPVINIRYSSLTGNGTINNPYIVEE